MEGTDVCMTVHTCELTPYTLLMTNTFVDLLDKWTTQGLNLALLGAPVIQE